jgi:integrase
MPLSIFSRNGVWYVRGTFEKVRVYASANTRDRSAAERIRVRTEKEILEASLLPGGVRRQAHRFTFAQGADDYLRHGKKAPHSQRTIAFVERLKAHFRNRMLDDVNQAAIDAAVAAIVSDDAAPATKIRAVIGPASAVLRHNAVRDRCRWPHLETPRVPTPMTPFLTPREAMALLEAASPHLKPLLIYLLGTGARVSEALYLDWSTVDLRAGHARFMTKNGSERIASLPPAVVEALANLPHRAGSVFRTDEGVPYRPKKRDNGGQIKTAWKGACKRAGLMTQAIDRDGGPAVDKGGRPVFITRFSPHALRHTWATWFFALSRNLLLLKDEGQWKVDQMVTRYAKLLNTAHEPEIAKVWGGAHPRIAPEMRAPRVQVRRRHQRNA